MPENNFNVFPCFSYPVYFSKFEYNFNEEEQKYIKSLDIENNGFDDTNKNKITSNKYILDNLIMKNFKDYITKILHHYAYEVLQIDEKVNQIYITQNWLNYNKKGTIHHKHNHPNSIISGTLCLQGEAPVQFSIDNTKYLLDLNYKTTNMLNMMRQQFEVKKGTVYFFPSILTHEVLENTNEEERISLSFNTFVKGNIGSEEIGSILKLN